MRTCLLGIALLTAALTSPSRGQTLEEVRHAVDDYFADDAAATASHAALVRWGNAALPFLGDLSGKPDDSALLRRLSPDKPDDWHLVCSLTTIDTPEAVDYLVEILDGKTAVAPYQALLGFQGATRKHAELLRSHVRFQQLVFKFAKDDRGPLSSICRGTAAELIADLEWYDGEPLLELMVQDDDLSLRKRAAAALHRLTHLPVEFRKPELAFPHAAAAEHLTLLVTRLNDDVRGRLDRWFDGKPALITGSGRHLESIDLRGYARASVDVGSDVADVLSLPLRDGSLRWVLLESGGGEHYGPNSDQARCVDWERNETWRYVPARAGIEAMCRLYDDAGCAGVAFGPGGEEGVVAFDGEGRELFRLPRMYVTYGLSSHPRLPDRWLHCGGRLSLYDNHGHAAGGSSRNPVAGLFAAGKLYANEAVLTVDEAGQAVVVAAGSGINSVPSIIRCDADLHEAWRATLADRVTALVLLEPPDRSPLIAATTAAGELLVFDLDGGLQQRLAMQNEDPFEAGGDVAVYSISAGPLPEGGYGLAVGLLMATLVYSVR